MGLRSWIKSKIKAKNPWGDPHERRLIDLHGINGSASDYAKNLDLLRSQRAKLDSDANYFSQVLQNEKNVIITNLNEAKREHDAQVTEEKMEEALLNTLALLVEGIEDAQRHLRELILLASSGSSGSGRAEVEIRTALDNSLKEIESRLSALRSIYASLQNSVKATTKMKVQYVKVLGDIIPWATDVNKKLKKHYAKYDGS